MKEHPIKPGQRYTYREIINFADENVLDTHRFGETPDAKERTFLAVVNHEAPVAYYMRITFERSDQDTYLCLEKLPKIQAMLAAARTFNPKGYCSCGTDLKDTILQKPILVGADFHSPNQSMDRRCLYFSTFCPSCAKGRIEAVDLDTPDFTPKILGKEIFACAKVWLGNHSWADDETHQNSGLLELAWKRHRAVDHLFEPSRNLPISFNLPSAPFVWF
ncbi:hypothetical protein [Geoalkalibacter subterraneus]|uniref:Uncharacterized protein n=1 Tax=Geoalkalibacter subterraneus TaxID=483547 RepID=A0A0B5FJ77_9BACT|nr:hypothetical protein [Geoalkalibacter subterraneus]AJF08232.1 hypothetical protein GSUB_17250 [Geoalkalibacter subterraneus]